MRKLFLFSHNDATCVKYLVIMLKFLKKLKPTQKSFETKFIYLIIGLIVGVVGTNLMWWYGSEEASLASSDDANEYSLVDKTDKSTDYLIDSITVDEDSEEEDFFIPDDNVDDTNTDILASKEIDTKDNLKTSSTTQSKKMKVNDIKNIARTLKGTSISAKTIIYEVNRIVTKENNSMVTGATIVKALNDKLPNSTKNKLINNVESIAVSNNVIRVKLKDASNIKLTFKTEEGKKTIKIYDNATIKIKNQSSRVSADVTGFRYQHLGMYWLVKDIDIQQKNQQGTLDIKLKGKLKDVDLPTITLGNLYRKIL